jgi:hypothetical protein
VLPRMRVLLDFLGTWFREARNEERVPKPAAAIAPLSNGKQANGAGVRLRAG